MPDLKTWRAIPGSTCIALLVCLGIPSLSEAHASQNSQRGTGNNQTVVQPGASIQQSSTGPCSPNIVGSGNTTNCGLPVKDRGLTAEQKNALKSTSVSDACGAASIDIWWEPTPEAASYAQDFIDSLGPLVGIRAPLSPEGRPPKGLYLSWTIEPGPNGVVEVPNPCVDELRLRFVVNDINFHPNGLNQRWQDVPPPFRPHGPPPTIEERTRRMKLRPETVIFVGAPETAQQNVIP